MFPVSVIAQHGTMVIYGNLFGGMHPVVFISMMYMYIETFPVSVNTQHGNMVIYGNLFGGMHPVVFISMMYMRQYQKLSKFLSGVFTHNYFLI